MKRILIIGCGGSGKTTLARRLGDALNLPVIHLDHFYWLPGHTRRPADQFIKLMVDACKQERWIMEGANLRTLELRLPYADTIIYLDIPRWRCLARIIMRFLQAPGKEGVFAPGCRNILTREFVSWVWHWRTRYHAFVLEKLAATGHARVVIVKTQEQLTSLIETLTS
ncbi:hypothetical protein EBZ39_09940 [bacterium]|nr:hypothetical protein [bacterium]